MWWQFIAQNLHFIIHIGATLVFFAISWLYYDAWQGKRPWTGLLSWMGFMLLGLGMLAEGTNIEQAVMGQSVLGGWGQVLAIGLRLVGYVALIVAQFALPLQAVPKNKGLEMKSRALAVGAVPAAGWWVLPFGALGVAALFWRRATTGLERHLKPIAAGFVVLSLSELFGLAALWRGTDNPLLDRWVASFGPLWVAEQVVLLVAVLVLGRWIWTYLTKRFFTQLLMIFVTSTVTISLIVSVGFTGLLLSNVRQQVQANLSTATNVLAYAVSARQAEVTAGAEQVAGSSDVVAALVAKDRAKLTLLTKDYLATKKQSGLTLIDQNGRVVLRAQDTEQWGDSLSGDRLVARALSGQAQSSLVTVSTASGSVLAVQGAIPVKDASGMVVGVALTSLEIGTAFVDGLKQATGLASSVYAGKTLSASTVLAPDGKTRVVGTVLSNATIADLVLTKGQSYQGEVSLGNRAMVGAFVPLKDVDNATVGMLVVAQPQSSILATAGRSVQLTFMMAAVLLLLSVVPIFWVTKSLTSQIE